MKCLIVIPHIFKPTKGSLYSSQTESKRLSKTKALNEATIGNLNRHNNQHWIHASLGNRKKITTRKLEKKDGIEISIEVYTNMSASLAGNLKPDPRLKIINLSNHAYLEIPNTASQRLIERWREYDILGYMEDDLLIEDPEFFRKIKYLQEILPIEYTVIPHRCEHIDGKGDVILSGDPDGGRPDLFWDTKEKLGIQWPTGKRELYRATNPHSGCFFISKKQAEKVAKHWQDRNWKSPFQLSGPLEQAASGRLIEVLKIMKPTPEDYQFLMIRHQDELWKRHSFE